MNWFFACWLWWNNFRLDWHHTQYLWLLNSSLVLFGPTSGRQKGPILQSCRLSGCFLGTGSLGFSECRKSLSSCAWQGQIFWITFLSQNWENGSKIGFLGLKKNLVVNFHWIVLQWKFILFSVLLNKSWTWKKSCSWDTWFFYT